MTRPSLRWLLMHVCVWCVCGVGVRVGNAQERTHIFVDQNLNRSKAQELCQQKHVHLSSILSEADYRKLRSLDYQRAATAWIGLLLGPQNWTWTDGSKLTFYNWRRRNEECGAVTSHGVWVDRDCSASLPFICETAQGRYQSFPEEETWDGAKSSCEGQGHKLATFKTASTKPERWPSTPHWMGLRREPTSWPWVWKWVDEGVGGSRAVLTYSNWQTSHYCGLMYYNGEWGDIACDRHYWYVCSDGHKHTQIRRPLSWHEAQKKCQDDNMHLVSIHNASQNTQLRRMYPGRFWIGLRDNPWEWPGGSSVQVQHWDSGQPSGSRDSNSGCVRMRDGQWDDVSCSEKLPFFCLMRPQEKLRMLTAPSSWEEALLHCRGLGGDLASIGNHDDQMLIQQVVQAAMATHVWVGLRFLAGEWLWVSGGGVSYQRWAGRQETCPLHHCGAIERSRGLWSPTGCEERLDFLCQLP